MVSRRRLVGTYLLASLTGGAVLLAGAPAQAPVPPADGQSAAVLQRYCMTCHNARLRTAGLSLDGLDVSHPAAHPEVWEKVIRKLRSRTMPPARLPRPDEATYDRLATLLEASLDQAAVAQPNPEIGRASCRERV